MKRSVTAALVASMFVVANAAADDAKANDEPRSIRNLMGNVPVAAVYDGFWSLYLNFATELTNRVWDAPYPWGTVGQLTTRILYGTSWTGMIGLESLILLLASHGTLDWLAEAKYRTDWIVGTDAPVCPSSGAYGGCGIGAGSMSFLQLRPNGSHWWLETGGGWIQQRIFNDEYRTVAESSWVLTPFSAVYEVKSKEDDDVSFSALAGPGIYFGMHNAHMHPTLKGQRDKDYRAPWTEMYPLDAGIGPGGRVEATVTFLRHLVVQAELIMAPFLLGGPTGEHPNNDIAPLDFDRDGISVWRKATFGVGWQDKSWPIRPILAAWGAELSERPVTLAGHRGIMLRFDIPLRGERK